MVSGYERRYSGGIKAMKQYWLFKDEYCDDYVVYREDPYCKYGEPFKNAFQVIPLDEVLLIKHERDLAITTLKEAILQRKIEVDYKQQRIEKLLLEIKTAMNYLESCGLKDVESPEFQMLQGFKKALEEE